MGKKLLSLALGLLLALDSAVFAHRVCTTKVDAPIHEGGLYGGVRWLYCLPTASDGDLQWGTTLTLTGPPLSLEETQNLSARVAEIEPDYRSGFLLDVGYDLPCTNFDIGLDYFWFRESDTDSATSLIRNTETYQFQQTFLGGGWASSDAAQSQRIDRAGLSLGAEYIVDGCLNLHPHVGVSFAHVRRDFDVQFVGFAVPPIVDPVPGTLVGALRSRYWGIGPAIGSSFSFPIFRCLRFSGHLGVGVLGGNVRSSIDSTSIRESLFQSFDAHDSSFRIAPIVTSDLRLTYKIPLRGCRSAVELSVGYEVDYYFRVVDRVDPIDGYVNNPGTGPKRTAGSIGFGAPYASIFVIPDALPYCVKNLLRVAFAEQRQECGFYASVENSWLKPHPTDNDLTYAILERADGSSQDQKIDPDYSWSGSYHVGYRSFCNVVIDAGYRTFTNRGGASTTARLGEGITSLNASGPEGVVFSTARSRVRYQLHQADLIVGKNARLCCPLDVYGFAGLRYVNVRRTLHNAYLGGEPPLLTQSKFPDLRSDYWGVGLLIGATPSFYLCDNFGITGLVDIALLVGSSNSKLDQVNFGVLLNETSNTLRTGDRQTIVPVVDTKVGVFWSLGVCRNLQLDLEAGYLFSDYFRVINLVFPNFLTGLGQNNSDLMLSGFYFTLNLSGF